ncbi:hypothetical protein AWW68_19535 [Roseivirga spongicola]|uniref:Uncharacterized protein n=1 Tax=Roseivirga spongicola TaxID=333140 RepID=A0A150XCH5_9BACT|nr:hypothetical protein [Roseivirga spongicola]KYG76439.1 hypothetical protein AWW68_19535 [Roseivirga spongicola]
MNNKRPCNCQLEIEGCFCEWDDEDFSKLRTKELSLLCEKLNQKRTTTVMNNQKDQVNAFKKIREVLNGEHDEEVKLIATNEFMNHEDTVVIPIEKRRHAFVTSLTYRYTHNESGEEL